MDVATLLLTIVRVIVGLLFVGHGSQKLFGWFEGHGFKGTTNMVTTMGFRPVTFWALMVGLGEFLGGLSFVFGFLTPIGAAALIGVMLVAISKVHFSKGLWNSNGGYEFPLLPIANAALFGITDLGYSLDAGLHFTWSPVGLFFIALVIVLIGVVAGYYTTLPRATTTNTTQVQP